MNGFIFADTPALLVARCGRERRCAPDCKRIGRNARAYLRFYGMGFDAYGLIASLYANDGAPWSVRGLSGDLSLDAQGRVRRVLPLAQFRNGRPVALGTLAPATDRLTAASSAQR